MLGVVGRVDEAFQGIEETSSGGLLVDNGGFDGRFEEDSVRVRLHSLLA